MKKIFILITTLIWYLQPALASDCNIDYSRLSINKALEIQSDLHFLEDLKGSNITPGKTRLFNYFFEGRFSGEIVLRYLCERIVQMEPMEFQNESIGAYVYPGLKTSILVTFADHNWSG